MSEGLPDGETGPGAMPTDPLNDQLHALLDPDGDLRRRTVHELDRTLRARSPMTSAIELLGLGWWTARVVLTDHPDRADEEDGGLRHG